MNRNILILPLILISSALVANQDEIDSLKLLLSSSKEDSSKVLFLGELSWRYQQKNPDSALIYAQEALRIAKGSGRKRSIASSLGHIGIHYKNVGQFTSALEYFRKSYKIQIEEDNRKGQSVDLNNIGEVHYYMGNYDSALMYYLESVRIVEELGMRENYAKGLNNLAVIYIHQGDTSKALSTFHQVLEIKRAIGMKADIASSLNNIAIILRMQGRLDKALIYLDESLDINLKINNKRSCATNYETMGNILVHQNRYEAALLAYQKAKTLYRELDSRKFYANLMNNIGRAYLEMNRPQLSLAYFDSCIFLSNLTKTREPQKHAYKNLSVAYSKLGNYRQALLNHQLYCQVKDSLLNIAKSEQLIEMNTKYQTEKKEKANIILKQENELQKAELNRRNLTIWGGGSGLVLILLFLFFVINRNRIIRKQKEQLQKDFKLKEAIRKEESFTSDKSIILNSGEVVKFSEVIFIKSNGNNLDVYCKNRKNIIHPRQTLTNIKGRLPEDIFFQVNRFCIVNINHIIKLDRTGIHIRDDFEKAAKHFIDFGRIYQKNYDKIKMLLDRYE